jgi:hypothetical protein
VTGIEPGNDHTDAQAGSLADARADAQAKRKVRLAYVAAGCLTIAGLIGLLVGDTTRGVIILVVGVGVGVAAVKQQRSLS